VGVQAEGKVPIVIYGAGIVGQALVKAGVKAQAFIDNNPNKHTCMKLPVLSVLRFKQMFPEAFVIISTADIWDTFKALSGYEWTTCGHYLANYEPTSTFERYAINTAINCQNAFVDDLEGKKLFLHSVDLIITERCSLKCKDCSNLMQYYEHPKDVGTAELLNSIDQLFSVVDEVNEVRVIGGEPFMNKDWHIIVKRLLEEPKLHYVVIYTNGTIVPDHLDALVNDKVMVLVTDYGHRNTKTLIAELKDHGIPCRIEKVGGWTACGEVKKHNRSRLNNEKVFRECCVHNLTNLSNGKLYRCPFEANAVRLGLIPDEGQPITTRDDIKAYIEKQSINACDWCNGRPFGAPEITPAIQKG
jgi:hypothetical protein